MKSNEIRRRFLEYFEQHGHEVYDSAPLLPSDPELLFNIAGMVPFKPYFLGDSEPEYTRVTSAQKCIRTEDIDNVGMTARHLTFFEMMGNFSFGDYFKREAIRRAWEFLTEEMELPRDHLWVTVFGGDEEQELEPDEEAERLWTEEVGVPAERIIRMGPGENFWKMGKTGPCGPCSEILYDQHQGDPDPEKVKRSILRGRDRILELWNLVFMQFNRSGDGTLSPLPDQNIDTGLGLERLAAVMQGVDNNFDTDLFAPIIKRTRSLADLPPRQEGQEQTLEDGTRVHLFPDRGIDRDTALRHLRAGRIVADHVRAAVFLLSEGLIPGNEGRGYVLRRLIRRALRWGRSLDFREPFLHRLVPTVIDIMGSHYEELSENRDLVQRRLKREEEQFLRTLEEGMDELRDRIRAVKSRSDGGPSTMDGDEIFQLYETYGFPVEMTTEILDEEGIQYSEDEIESAREEHRQKSQGSWESEGRDLDLPVGDLPETTFQGYDHMQSDVRVVGLFRDGEPVKQLEPGQAGQVVTDRTPFYPEGGGQVGDTGRLNGFVVEDTQSLRDRIVHFGEAERPLERGETVHAEVQSRRRRAVMRHHTGTHLLQAALRDQLGEGVMQDGSLVAPDYLRFDFTYDRRVDRDQLRAVEQQINEWVYQEIPLESEVMSREEAEQQGALAFFGEHYGDTVRVVRIGDVSIELCGGTHLDNTVDLGLFVITNETSVAAGVRRIEARAGKPAYDYFCEQRGLLERSTATAGVQSPGELRDRIVDLQERIDEYEDRLEEYRKRQSARQAEALAESTEDVDGVPVMIQEVEEDDEEAIKQMLDNLRQRLEQGVILLIQTEDGGVRLYMGVTENLTSEIDAGEWIRELGQVVGGGGGGRSHFAQAGGSRPEAVPQVKQRLRELIRDRHGTASRH